MYRNFIFVGFCLSLNCVQPTHVTQDFNWDLLIFTQSWPETVCKIWTEHNSKHTCKFPKKRDSWSIHGIWPTKLGTIGPGFCNKTWLFRPEEIKPIEDLLFESWTNVEAETSTYSFWAHEWSKHGTCASSVEALNGEYKYFSKGLKLLSAYSMNDVLSSANILPSDDKEYQATDFYNAIKTKLGVNPAIECRNDGGKQYLMELRICFKKSLQIISCDGVKFRDMETNNEASIITNCNPSKGIIYPHYEAPNKILVQLYKLVSWIQWLTL